MADLENLGRKLAARAVYKIARLDFFDRYKWMCETFHWPPEKRGRWRLDRLGDILEFCWKEVPFYREYWGDHGVRFERPRAFEELQKFPVLTKNVFRANSTRIRPNSLDGIRYRKWHTGGTTGQPVHYNRDLEQWILCEAFQLWGWTQIGYRFGDPVGVIAGGSLIPKNATLEGRLRSWLHHRLFLYGIAMDSGIARSYHEQLVRHRIKFLYGYPSVLYLFSRHLIDMKLRIDGVQAVVTTSEMLLPRYRDTIEEGLGCPVYDNLGCNDGGYESFECKRHDGYHYNDLQSILEVDSVQEEGHGRLLITNLVNRSTPFIRYENGDMVSLSTEPCSCGSSFPKIASIQGRTTDILTFSNGRSISGPGLTVLLGKYDIDGYQVVQKERDKLEVRICSRRPMSEFEMEQIREVLRYYLDASVEVGIRQVDRLETTHAGKFRYIWSEVS